jgi:outer membrane protein assembly factor BamB
MASGSAEPRLPPVAGDPVQGDGQPADVAGAWPWFRGPELDGICRDETPLARSWPPEGPPVLWSLELGEGYASAAIREGRVYVLDYDEQAGADTMRCLSLEDGREIWHNSYPVLVTRNHGISRTVPAVVGDCVISLGPRCHVACWDAESGRCNWLIDMELEHGAVVPRWYAGQCPLVDQDRLILAPCGDALLMAVNYETGEVIWESPNPRAWEMTHSSIVPMQFQGRRMYIYYGSGGVAGVAADDGTLLWDRTDWPSQFATSPSPVVLPEGRIFLSSGYGNAIGAQILQLQSAGEQIVAEKIVELHPRQFNSEQHTPILFDGHLYAIRKHGGGPLMCLDLDGEPQWDSGKERFGHGPYLIADGLIFAMNNSGQLTMAEATPDQYRPLGQFQAIPDAHDAWGPMAMVAGRLIVRDMTRMVCLDVSDHQ